MKQDTKKEFKEFLGKLAAGALAFGGIVAIIYGLGVYIDGRIQTALEDDKIIRRLDVPSSSTVS